MTSAEERAGCYVLYAGQPVHWGPTAWSKVDTNASARLRVKLEVSADTSGPLRPAFAVSAGQRRIDGYYVWQPTSDGFRISQAGVDTRFEMALAGDSALLRGSGRSAGTIEGGAYRYPVVARRAKCDGFAVGYDSPRG